MQHFRQDSRVAVLELEVVRGVFRMEMCTLAEFTIKRAGSGDELR